MDAAVDTTANEAKSNPIWDEFVSAMQQKNEAEVAGFISQWKNDPTLFDIDQLCLNGYQTPLMFIVEHRWQPISDELLSILSFKQINEILGGGRTVMDFMTFDMMEQFYQRGMHIHLVGEWPQTELMQSISRCEVEKAIFLACHMSAKQIQVVRKDFICTIDDLVSHSQRDLQAIQLFGTNDARLTFRRLETVIDKDYPLAIENVMAQCRHQHVIGRFDHEDLLERALQSHQWEILLELLPCLSHQNIEYSPIYERRMTEKESPPECILFYQVFGRVRADLSVMDSDLLSAIMILIDRGQAVAMSRLFTYRHLNVSQNEDEIVRAVIEKEDYRMMEVLIRNEIGRESILDFFQRETDNENVRAKKRVFVDLIEWDCLCILEMIVDNDYHLRISPDLILNHVIEQDKFDVMKLLVNKGVFNWNAFVQARYEDRKKFHPMFYCCHYGWTEMIPVLAELGADWSHERGTRMESYPIQVATRANQVETARFLVENYGVMDVYTEPACVEIASTIWNNYDMLRYWIVDAKCDLSQCQTKILDLKDGATDEYFLDQIISRGDGDCLEALIKLQPNLNILVINMIGNDEKNDLMHKCSAANALPLVELLMKPPYNLSPNSLNELGQTSLHVAHGEEVIRKLLYYCDPNKEDKYGRKAFDTEKKAEDERALAVALAVSSAKNWLRIADWFPDGLNSSLKQRLWDKINGGDRLDKDGLVTFLHYVIIVHSKAIDPSRRLPRRDEISEHIAPLCDWLMQNKVAPDGFTFEDCENEFSGWLREYVDMTGIPEDDDDDEDDKDDDAVDEDSALWLETVTAYRSSLLQSPSWTPQKGRDLVSLKVGQLSDLEMKSRRKLGIIDDQDVKRLSSLSMHRENLLSCLSSLGKCYETDCDQDDEEGSFRRVLEEKLRRCDATMMSIQRRNGLIVNETDAFVSQVDREEFLNEFETEDGDAFDRVLEELDELLACEVDLCIEVPSYFRKLQQFATNGAENIRFHGMGWMYKGVGTMIATNIKKYSQESGSWGECVEKLEEIGRVINEEERPKYLELFLGGDRSNLRQPRWDLPKLFSHALLAQERLNFEMAKLAKMTGGLLYNKAGVKSMFRTKEKKAYSRTRLEKKDFNLWDLSRAMISYDTLHEIIYAIETLRDNASFSNCIEIINFWNRFKKEPDERWADVMIHVVFVDDPSIPPNERILCEIQFSIMQLTMTRKNLGGHDAYSNFRCAIEVRRCVEGMI